MDGWVKMYRCITEDEVWNEPYRLKCWLWLIFNASFKKGKQYINSINMYIQVDRGQVAITLTMLADKIGVHKNTISKMLNEFVEQEKIAIKSIHKYTIITILNYEKYQNLDSENDVSVNVPVNNQIISELDTNRDTNDVSVNVPVNVPLYYIEERKENILLDKGEPNENFLAELKTDRGYQETIAMQNQISIEFVQRLIEEYKTHLTLGDVRHDTRQGFRSHFRDWVRIKAKEQNKNTNQQANGNQIDKYTKRRGTAPSPPEDFIDNHF